MTKLDLQWEQKKTDYNKFINNKIYLNLDLKKRSANTCVRVDYLCDHDI